MSAVCERMQERLPQLAAGEVETDAAAGAHLAACADCRAALAELRTLIEAPTPHPATEGMPETAAPRIVREDLLALGRARGRAPWIAAGAAAVTVVAAMLLASRRDLPDLSPLHLFGAVACLVVLGTVGLLLGARLSALRPGRALAYVSVALVAFAAFAAFGPDAHSSEVPAAGLDTIVRGVPCFFVATAHAFLSLGLFAAIVSGARVFPTSAVVTAGVGAGLLSTTVVALFCPIAVALHVLVAHGGAIVAAAIVAVGTARLVERRALLRTKP